VKKSSLRHLIVIGLGLVIILATMTVMIESPWQSNESIAARSVDCWRLWTGATESNGPFHLRPTPAVIKMEHSRQFREYGNAFRAVQYLSEHPPKYPASKQGIVWQDKYSILWQNEKDRCQALLQVADTLSVHSPVH